MLLHAPAVAEGQTHGITEHLLGTIGPENFTYPVLGSYLGDSALERLCRRIANGDLNWVRARYAGYFGLVAVLRHAAT